MLVLVLRLIVPHSGAMGQAPGSPAGPPDSDAAVPIADVRLDRDGDGVPDRMGDTVTVAGRATVAGGALHTSQTQVYVQDSTAGIHLFSIDEPPQVSRGDSVVATGVVDRYNGLTQLQVLELRVVAGVPTRVPDPVLLDSPPWDLEGHEGLLVRLRGRILNRGSNEGGRYLLLGGEGNGTDRVLVFVAHEAGTAPELDRYQLGDVVEATGPVAQWDPDLPHTEGYELLPRGPDDLVAVGLTRGRTRLLLLGGGAALLILLFAVGTLFFRFRERAESLSRAERRFESIFQGIVEPLMVLDPDGAIREANPAASTALGGDRIEVMNRGLLGLLHPDDRDTARSRMSEAWETDTVAEFVARTTDFGAGHRRLAFRVTVAPVRGRPMALVMAHDLTEEEETLEALRTSRERLELVLGQVPAIVWTVDENLRFVWSMGSGLESLGLEPNEAVGMSLFEYFGTDDPDFPPVQAHRRALEGESVSYEAAWEGRVYESHVQPLRSASGEVEGVVGVALDVTETRRTKSELEEQRAYFTRLFEEAPEAIVVLDEEDTVLALNPEYTRMFGYTEDEAVGRKNSDLVVPEHLREEADGLTRKVASGSRINVEAVRQRKDGTPVRVSILSTPVELEGRTVLYGIYRDITERKELEEQFLHSQKMEAVGHLAGGVAHDFHNLLTVVLGHAELAYAGTESEAVREDLEAVRDAVKRASSLTRQLLTFSRKDLSRPRTVQVNEVLETVRLLVERVVADVHDLEWSLEPGLPPVRIDPGQLEQVVMNLAVNAADAMPGGGSLRVRTSSTTADAVADAGAPMSPGSELVVITVSDTGTGMTRETRSRMFEPFFTTKEQGKGTGLGLSTVYGIVEKAGGFISVNTGPGEGTEVCVFLPAAGPEEAEKAGGAREEESGDFEGTILLVEDDAPVRHAAQRVLRREGYRVRVAEECHQALRILDEAGEGVDLLLTDVALPEMSGFDLADRVRERQPGVAVLFMSGYREIERGHSDEDARAFLAKPFQPDTLARRVREVLGGTGG